MFDNIGTALVQAVGFFGVFGFFVYQLLSDGKKPIQTQLKSPTKKVNKTMDSIDKPEKRGLFGRKKEPIKVDVKPKKKGLFGKKVESVKVVEEPKKKGWFRQIIKENLKNDCDIFYTKNYNYIFIILR